MNPSREQVLFELLFGLESHPRKVFTNVHISDKTVAFVYEGYTYRLQVRRRVDDPSYDPIKARNRRVYYVKRALRDHDPVFFEQRKQLHQLKGKNSATATAMAYTDLHKLYQTLWDKLHAELVTPPLKPRTQGKKKDVRWKAVRKLQEQLPAEWKKELKTTQARYPNQTKSWAHGPARLEFKNKYREQYQKLLDKIREEEYGEPNT